MADPNARDLKLIQYLNEAYGTEKQLETALEAHIAMTTRDAYRKRLRDHLKETKRHGREVERRIKQLGGKPETVSVPGPEAATGAAQAVQTAVGKAAAAAAQGPLHMLRGTGEQEKLLKNAKTEYQSEAEEIATYTAIQTLAEAVGDRDTAKLARSILREEQRMAAFLERLIPTLTKAVATAEIPSAERGGGRRRSSSRRSSAAKRSSSSSARSGSSAAKRPSRSRTSSAAKRSSSSRSSGSAAKRSSASRSSGATAKRSGARRSSAGSRKRAGGRS